MDVLQIVTLFGKFETLNLAFGGTFSYRLEIGIVTKVIGVFLLIYILFVLISFLLEQEQPIP